MATAAHCCYCFDVLLSICYPNRYSFPKKPKPSFENDECPIFVTFKKSNKHGKLELRGCIGTFSPVKLYKGLYNYTISSSTKDSRFSPIQQNEIRSLTCAVSLLVNFEETDNIWDWEVGIHGIIIKWKDHKGKLHNATYLPEVASEFKWDKKQTLISLVKKAGYNLLAHEDIELLGIKLTRYQSTKFSISFEDYLNYHRNSNISSLLISSSSSSSS